MKRSEYHSEMQSAATIAKKLKELNVVYQRIFLFYIGNYGVYREFTHKELEGCKTIEEIKIVLDCLQGYVRTSVITTTCSTYNSRLIHFTNLYAYLRLKGNSQVLLQIIIFLPRYNVFFIHEIFRINDRRSMRNI